MPKAARLTWPDSTELIGLSIELQPLQASSLYAQYAIALHAWFLDQVRQTNPDLSAALHDGEEKPFTISALEGLAMSDRSSGKPATLQLDPSQTYYWRVTALSQPVAQWLKQWVKQPPQTIELRGAPLTIREWSIALPPQRYAKLSSVSDAVSVVLSFRSPTSFRRKGHHLPLPLPRVVFQSYLRRWNDFSGCEVESEAFLDWVDEAIVITRHQLRSHKVAAGKQGSVTGFTGAVEFSVINAAQQNPDYVKLFQALGQLAPYCGTGHKTTFGLGQTALGWSDEIAPDPPALQTVLADRITDLTEQFQAQRKRTGGDRARHVAETWATILARRELGESLQAIAQDLEMPYETVKTYAKLARRSLHPTP